MIARRLCKWGAAVCLVVAGTSVARAHEPIHSPGPVTLWEGGTAVELFADVSWGDALWHGSHRDDDPVHGKSRAADFRLHVAHGITADFMAILDVPIAWRAADRGGTTQRAAGLGDIWLGAKYRFYRDQTAPARSNMAAVFALAHLDTGSQSSAPALGNGAPEVMLGSAAARDALFLYLWGSVRAFVPIPGGRSLTPWGLSVSGAIGTRFWEPSIGGADIVVMLETEYHAESPAQRHGHQVANTGHQRWSVGPGMFFYYDQFEFKAGVQITAWGRARGRQYLTDAKAAIGIGVLF